MLLFTIGVARGTEENVSDKVGTSFGTETWPGSMSLNPEYVDLRTRNYF